MKLRNILYCGLDLWDLDLGPWSLFDVVPKKIKEFVVVVINYYPIKNNQYREDKRLFNQASCFESPELLWRDAKSDWDREKPWDALCCEGVGNKV